MGLSAGRWCVRSGPDLWLPSQVQQSILIQAKQSASLQPAPQPQSLAPAHFISQQDPSAETVMLSSSGPVGPPAPPGAPLLQPKSVLVKTPVLPGGHQCTLECPPRTVQHNA